MTTKKRGRPATGRGPRIYIPIERVKAVKLLKAIPGEQIPAIEVILQGLVDRAKKKKSPEP